MTGEVKCIKFEKGFGFIATSSGDIFFHARDLERAPFDEQIVGREVQFEVTDTPKGRRAQHVQPVRA